MLLLSRKHIANHFYLGKLSRAVFVHLAVMPGNTTPAQLGFSCRFFLTEATLMLDIQVPWCYSHMVTGSFLSTFCAF